VVGAAAPSVLVLIVGSGRAGARLVFGFAGLAGRWSAGPANGPAAARALAGDGLPAVPGGEGCVEGVPGVWVGGEQGGHLPPCVRVWPARTGPPQSCPGRRRGPGVAGVADPRRVRCGVRGRGLGCRLRAVRGARRG
jgi:hypothetical protein